MRRCKTSHREGPRGCKSNQRLDWTLAASANQISTVLCHNVPSITAVTEIGKGKKNNEQKQRAQMENHWRHIHQARLHRQIFENDTSCPAWICLTGTDYLLGPARWFHVHDLAHACIHNDAQFACLKWENNEPQCVSIKFISCTVPQAVGRWGPPPCTYFHKSSCVMTLPRCKWTRWGQRTEWLDWWRPFLVRKKPNKKTCGPCGNTVFGFKRK